MMLEASHMTNDTFLLLVLAAVPLSLLADYNFKTVPPSRFSENLTSDLEV